MDLEIGHFFKSKRLFDPSDGWLEIDGREPVSSKLCRNISGESKAQSNTKAWRIQQTSQTPSKPYSLEYEHESRGRKWSLTSAVICWPVAMHIPQY